MWRARGWRDRDGEKGGKGRGGRGEGGHLVFLECLIGGTFDLGSRSDSQRILVGQD